MILKGCNLLSYKPKCGEITLKDYEKVIKKYHTNTALGLIGTISWRLIRQQEKLLLGKQFGSRKYHDTPIIDSALSFMSLKLIECSNDYNRKDLTIEDLVKLCDMWFGLKNHVESMTDDETNFIRFSTNQFEYQRELRNCLGRTITLYKNLWLKVKIDNNDNIDIENKLLEKVGLTLYEIFGLGYFFFSRSSKGFISIVSEDFLREQFPNVDQQLFAETKQERFLKLISCTYQQFRAKLHKENIPKSSYEIFRFNPLIEFPIIEPNIAIFSDSFPVYLTPIPRLIHDRFTRGLYYIFSEIYKKPKHNKFRENFGHVFEEYIGLQLNQNIRNADVIPEFKYGKDNSKSPDFIILKGDKAVYIEVKASGLHKDAKLWGDLRKIKRNLNDNIAHGVNQMWKFERNIELMDDKKLSFLRNMKSVERLIVTHDRSYFANSIIKNLVRDVLREEYTEVDDLYHWHVISVEELEYALGAVGDHFFDFLKEKRCGIEGDKMDFRDYFPKHFARDEFSNPFLDKVNRDFFKEMGFPIKDF